MTVLQAGDEGPEFLPHLARLLLLEGVTQLEGTERACAELFLIKGRSVRQIAEELDLSHESATYYCHQAQESLRSILSVEPT